MVDKKTPIIIITCGEGGHAEEMRRLLSTIQGRHHVPYVLISEGNVNLSRLGSNIIHQETCKPLRTKHFVYFQPKTLLTGAKNAGAAFWTAFRILKTYDVRLIVSTGPGVGILVGIAGRLFGCRIIHVETWCRFSTRSITGRLMHVIATDFWIQHRSLAPLYAKSKFVGML